MKGNLSETKLDRRDDDARIGAFEAKDKLGQRLDLVERGEEAVITRHGRQVAAACLELAVRMSLPLATLDEDLRAAGGQIGVGLLGMA